MVRKFAVDDAIISGRAGWTSQNEAPSIARASAMLSVMSDIALPTQATTSYEAMLEVAFAEARAGLASGGIPIGAAIFDSRGRLVSSGYNRRVQQDDPSIHGETDAFRRAGRQRSYRDLTMVTTLAPCWYCSGLIRQFGFQTVVVGESINFAGGMEWLRQAGINVVDLGSPPCIEMMAVYIQQHPDIWYEDIGEPSSAGNV